MQKTPHFNLPLVAAAQAQKHITVNEAMARLDALVQLRLVSITQTSVPRSPAEGTAYFVPSTRTGSDAWTGLQGQIALYINGGWTGITPKRGWQAWVESDNSRRSFNGSVWEAEAGGGEAISTSANGAQTQMKIYEHTHNLTYGSYNRTEFFIPSHSIVFGVTARVTATIGTTGARSWKMGVSGRVIETERYGTLYGLSRGSHAAGITSAPVVYYRNSDLRIAPASGNFSGSGQIVFAVHAMKFTPPNSV